MFRGDGSGLKHMHPACWLAQGLGSSPTSPVLVVCPIMEKNVNCSLVIAFCDLLLDRWEVGITAYTSVLRLSSKP